MNQQFYNKDDDNVVDIDMKAMRKKIFTFGPIIIIVLVIAFVLLNSVYMLENRENAVVLRFGRVNEVVTDPGLHFKVPLMDQVEKVDVRSIYNMEYGFRTESAGTETENAQYSDQQAEATIIVDGANNNASIALIELIIQYRVNNPVDYLFKVDDPEGTLRLALEDVIRSSVQSLTLDEAKTQKELIDASVLPKLQQKMVEYESGLEIILVGTQNVQFLENVEAAYQQKENANQYKNGKREDAEKYNNTVIPQAQAEATKLVEDAYAYRAEVVANANAGVAEFNALYREYINNPDILKERYYIDSMTAFLSNNKIVVDGTAEGDIYKFYNFDDAAIKQSVTN
jgi:membrane protease subunit HflK